ncbi:hypothetical protein UB31_36095 [Bradyrhizobium sp. LTSP849]|nr:hypothetical protein UB31_36095 [Bradyrhizobium sp. LTSP849]
MQPVQIKLRASYITAKPTRWKRGIRIAGIIFGIQWMRKRLRVTLRFNSIFPDQGHLKNPRNYNLTTTNITAVVVWMIVDDIKILKQPFKDRLNNLKGLLVH